MVDGVERPGRFPRVGAGKILLLAAATTTTTTTAAAAPPPPPTTTTTTTTSGFTSLRHYFKVMIVRW